MRNFIIIFVNVDFKDESTTGKGRRSFTVDINHSKH